MSFKEVMDLRKSGKQEEALMMAETGLQAAPDEVWNKRAYAWVGYDFLKKAAENNDLQEMARWIEEIKKLGLTAEDNMVYDSIAWPVGKYLFSRDVVSTETLNRLFTLIRYFHFSRPGKAYSFLLKAFNKQAKEWQAFPAFLAWWGTDHFLPEDYQGFVTEQGQKLLSPVEQVLITVSKHLLTPPVNREQVEQLLPWIARIAGTQSQMLYPPYYYAKLLIALGNREDFLKAFIPFAKKKKRDFWVWDLLGEAFEKDAQEYFSCLCKSLACGAPGKYTLKVKEKLAQVFEGTGHYPEAKREYLDILKVRKKEGWPLREKQLAWETRSWWKATEPVADNLAFYGKHKKLAEQLLFSEIPETLIVTDSVNRKKQVLSFVALPDLYGFIYYGKQDIYPDTGEALLVRFKEPVPGKKSNFRQVYTMRETDRTPPPEIYKTAAGKILIRPGNSYGFVEDVFVPENLIQKENIIPGQQIQVEAVMGYNRKKKNRGWKAVKIMKPRPVATG